MCVSPWSRATASMARHTMAMGGPACWCCGSQGPRVSSLASTLRGESTVKAAVGEAWVMAAVASFQTLGAAAGTPRSSRSRRVSAIIASISAPTAR